LFQRRLDSFRSRGTIISTVDSEVGSPLSKGLLSQKSIRRWSEVSMDDCLTEVDAQPQNQVSVFVSDSSGRNAGASASAFTRTARCERRNNNLTGSIGSEVANAFSRGLLSDKSMRRLSEDDLSMDSSSTGGDGSRVQEEQELMGQHQQSFVNGENNDCGSMPKKVIRNMKRGTSGRSYNSGEIRMAEKGLMSKSSMLLLSGDASEIAAGVMGGDCEGQDSVSRGLVGGESVRRMSEENNEENLHVEISRIRDEIEAKLEAGHGSDRQNHSVRKMSNDDFSMDNTPISVSPIEGLVEGQVGHGSVSHIHEDDTNRRYPAGEIEMARKGCLSRETRLDLRRKGLIKGTNDDSTKSLSKKDPNIQPDQQKDILAEGQDYLSISMLVYMYSILRETCRMGHTRVKMEEIDVHSFQSHREGLPTRYLDPSSTKTAGSIVRNVIDELERTDENSKENGVAMDKKSRKYEKSNHSAILLVD